MYGEDWFNVINELYSKELVMILMSRDSHLGDMITFDVNGNNYGAIFVLNENNQLTAWDVHTNTEVGLEAIDSNGVTGLYSMNDASTSTFSLSESFRDDLPSTIDLNGNWLYGNQNFVKSSDEITIKEPSIFAAASFILGTIDICYGSRIIGAIAYGAGTIDFIVNSLNVDEVYRIQEYPSYQFDDVPPMPIPQGTPAAPFPLFP